jgi:ABC-type Co2+ transport system, permease component
MFAFVLGSHIPHVPKRPPALHIPDGFLNLPISLLFWLISIALVALALRRSRNLNEHQLPLMGIMAAFIFAAQMINFPVVGGTSGHLLGGSLAAITLGPWAGMLVMSCVIGVQALLFQDGGLLAMGANIFNMGLLTAVIGYGLYRIVAQRSQRLRLLGAGLAAWLSVVAGALLTALQLWLSGTSSLQIVMPAMLGIHALIGIGEALITVAALAFILRTRPDLLNENAQQDGRAWIIGGVVATVLVVLLAPFASADPDGLERVAEDLGFIERGQDAPYQLIPDYSFPLLGETSLSTIVAGLVGLVVVAALSMAAARLIQERKA